MLIIMNGKHISFFLFKMEEEKAKGEEREEGREKEE